MAESKEMHSFCARCGGIGQEIADALLGFSLDVCGIICSYVMGGPPTKRAPQSLHSFSIAHCRIHAISCDRRSGSVWVTWTDLYAWSDDASAGRGKLSRLVWNSNESAMELSHTGTNGVYGVACNGKRVFATAQDGWMYWHGEELRFRKKLPMARLPDAVFMPIAANGDRVVLCDPQMQVFVLDEVGDSCLSTWSCEVAPVSVALTSRNELVVLERNTVHVFDPEGQSVRQMDVGEMVKDEMGSCVVVDGRDNVFVVNESGGVMVLDRLGQLIAQFKVPVGWVWFGDHRLRYVQTHRLCVDDSNRIYVAGVDGVSVFAFEM